MSLIKISSILFVLSFTLEACGYLNKDSASESSQNSADATGLRGICSSPAGGMCTESTASNKNSYDSLAELCTSFDGNSWTDAVSCDTSEASAICDLGKDSPMSELFEKSQIVFSKSKFPTRESARAHCDMNNGILREQTGTREDGNSQSSTSGSPNLSCPSVPLPEAVNAQVVDVSAEPKRVSTPSERGNFYIDENKGDLKFFDDSIIEQAGILSIPFSKSAQEVYAGAVYFSSDAPNNKSGLRPLSQDKCGAERYRNVAIFALILKDSNTLLFYTLSSTAGGLIVSNKLNSFSVTSGTIPTDWINGSSSAKKLGNTSAGGLKTESASLTLSAAKDELKLVIPFRSKNYSVTVPLRKFQLNGK